MRRAIVLMLLVASLAGCASDSEPTQACEPDCGPTVDPDDVDADKGVIRGIVIDGQINPIADANIKVTGTELSAVTGEDGQFLFVNVDPGAYFISVSRPGYSTIQTSTQVEAGVAQPELVRIQLEIKPGTEPFAVYQTYDGYIGCAVKVANRVFPNQCEPLGDPDRNEVMDFGTNIIPEMVQTEIVWKQTQEFGRDLGTIQYVQDENGERQRVGNVWGPSPLICTVTKTNVCDNGDGTGGGGDGLNTTGFPGKYYASVYAACYQQCVIGAVGAGLITQQQYTMYGAAFFNTLPPEGWTLGEDGQWEP